MSDWISVTAAARRLGWEKHEVIDHARSLPLSGATHAVKFGEWGETDDGLIFPTQGGIRLLIDELPPPDSEPLMSRYTCIEGLGTWLAQDGHAYRDAGALLIEPYYILRGAMFDRRNPYCYGAAETLQRVAWAFGRDLLAETRSLSKRLAAN